MKPSVRFEVFRRDAFTCRYCGRKSPDAILEVDHVIPLSEGGGDQLDNLTTSCSDCNRGKAARLLTATIPDAVDLHERTVAIAEEERQRAEYRHWRDIQRQRENEDIASLREHWERRWPACEAWSSPSIRRFLKKLDIHDLQELVEMVIHDDRFGRGSNEEAAAFKYFCGAVWQTIRNGGANA